MKYSYYIYKRKGRFGFATYDFEVDAIEVKIKANGKVGADFAMKTMYGQDCFTNGWRYIGKIT